jgi:hypothetical protein
MSWLFEVDTRFNIADEFVGWVPGSEELFLSFKIFFLLDTRDPCIEEPFLAAAAVVVVVV